MGKLYDSKCLELAEHFLTDEPDLNSARSRAELAQDIQDTIEAWIESERDERSKSP